MRFLAVSMALPLLLGASLALIACESDTDSPQTPAFDAGNGGFDGGGPSEGGPVADAANDTDAGATDAGADADADASGPKNALFGHLDGTLVAINPDTGAVTDIGPTGQDTIVLAWDDKAKVARAIIGNYSPNGAGATLTPKLATIDLCTGAVTEGPILAVGANQVRRGESIAQDPATGTFYVTYGTAGTDLGNQFLSQLNGSVDVATGAITPIGSHATLQNDGDCTTFVGSALHLLDVATGSNAGAVYTVDKGTGQATKVKDLGPLILRIAHDPTRNVMFATRGAGSAPNATLRGIATVNLTTGVRTDIGADLAASVHPGQQFTALVSAPPPVCP